MIPTYYDAPDVFEGSMPMRGDDQQTGWMFSYVSPEERVPADHPLRAIRQMTDAIFERLSPRFDRLYSTWAGRRFRRRSCCARCCCRASIRFAASGC